MALGSVRAAPPAARCATYARALDNFIQETRSTWKRQDPIAVLELNTQISGSDWVDREIRAVTTEVGEEVAKQAASSSPKFRSAIENIEDAEDAVREAWNKRIDAQIAINESLYVVLCGSDE